MKNIAIFASGSGTNAENIAKYFANNNEIRVVLVLSNNANAKVHDRMRKLKIPSYTFSKNEFSEGTAVLSKLKEYHIDFIVLAGYMNKITSPLLKAYPQQIINIHPALLPKFGGKGMYGMHVHEAVVAAGEKESGITIHFVNENYDEGAIIFQANCPVLSGDSPEQVAEKVHQLEYAHFPHVIEEVIQKTT